jgi:hypothetical protein
MHQALPLIGGIAPHDTHPERPETGRLAEANDRVIGCSPDLGHSIDLVIAQPFGPRAPVGAQQSQVDAIQVKAPAVVTAGGQQAEYHIATFADAEKIACEQAQVCAQACEGCWIKALQPQQLTDVSVEGLQ